MAQEAAGYLNFKRERRKREWHTTEKCRLVRWNAYAMNLGRGIADSAGFMLISTIEEKEVRMSDSTDLIDGLTGLFTSGGQLNTSTCLINLCLFLAAVRVRWRQICSCR